MKKIIVIVLILVLLSNFLFAEEIIFALNTKPTKREIGMLVSMGIIATAIIAPIVYEGLRVVKTK